MGLLGILKKLAVRLELKSNSVFACPVDRQKAYLARFPEPRDDVDRSYFQYRCQMKLNRPAVNVLINLGAIPLLLYYFWKKPVLLPERPEEKDAVFFAEGLPENVIPGQLRREFPRWHTARTHGEFLGPEERREFWKLWRRRPVSFLFLLKILIKLRFYGYERHVHSPKALVTCGEYSFTSSALTGYCRQAGVLHIDCMHGEKLFYMRDSFFRFDRCHVWSQAYVDLFTALRAAEGQFVIAVPDSLRFAGTEVEKTVAYTYYLGGQRGASLERIVSRMAALAAAGAKAAIRPHPRYTDRKELEALAAGTGLLLEDPGTLSVEESLLRTKYAVSLYSTVLNQAVNNGVAAVIDDVTDPDFFRKLSELEYAMLKEPHMLLSQLLKPVSGGSHETTA